MMNSIEQAILGALSVLVVGAIQPLFRMWRDIGINKQVIDQHKESIDEIKARLDALQNMDRNLNEALGILRGMKT